MLTLAYSVTGFLELKTPFLFFFRLVNLHTYAHMYIYIYTYSCMHMYIYTHTHLHTYGLRSQACQRSNAECKLCFSLRSCEIQSSLNFVWMLTLKLHMLFRTGAIYSKEIIKFKYYGNYCTYLREIIERLILAIFFFFFFNAVQVQILTVRSLSSCSLTVCCSFCARRC